MLQHNTSPCHLPRAYHITIVRRQTNRKYRRLSLYDARAPREDGCGERWPVAGMAIDARARVSLMMRERATRHDDAQDDIALARRCRDVAAPPRRRIRNGQDRRAGACTRGHLTACHYVACLKRLRFVAAAACAAGTAACARRPKWSTVADARMAASTFSARSAHANRKSADFSAGASNRHGALARRRPTADQTISMMYFMFHVPAMPLRRQALSHMNF